VSVVAFERDSSLEGICDSGFRESELRSIVVPSSVVVLGKESFHGCRSLESVTFESGSRLERIERSAFSGTVIFSNKLKSVLIPSSVVVLGKRSFGQCKSLESVTFESGSRLERIEKRAFQGSGLRSILIPSSVVVLGKESFHWCKSLESVIFESVSRLERIEESAFFASELRSIVIPASVAFLGASAFAAKSLNSISVSRDNQYFRIRESFLEDICGSIICRYFGSCRSIVVPSSAVVLGEGCFSECKSLESATFESGPRLERIEASAFAKSGLKSILIPSSVVVLGGESFNECKSLESVTFESGCRLKRINQSMFRGSGVSFSSLSEEFALGKRSGKPGK
jgi:hypothetical protein